MALDLTTLEEVKALAAEEGTSQDATFESLITQVSRRVEQYMRRDALVVVDREEIYSVRRHERVISLRAAPVVHLNIKTNLTTRDFDVKWSQDGHPDRYEQLNEYDDYIVEAEFGICRLINSLPTLHTPLGRESAPASVKIRYTAGMAADTPAFVEAYPDIAGAVALQVVYLFKRRNSPGGNIVVGDSGTSFTKDYMLLKEVRETLNQYKRRSMS